MIFAKIITEGTIRENDKTRLDPSSSFSNGDPITSASVSIDGGVAIDVLEQMYLDYEFSAESHTIELTISDGTLSDVESKTVEVLTAANDIIFSSDSDLVAMEDDILKYVREGKSTFIDKHRIARDLILDELDANRIYKEDGSRYAASDVADIDDFKKWSIYLTLQLIYSSNSTQSGDFFEAKAKKYEDLVEEARGRSFFRLTDTEEIKVDSFTGELNRL